MGRHRAPCYDVPASVVRAAVGTDGHSMPNTFPALYPTGREFFYDQASSVDVQIAELEQDIADDDRWHRRGLVLLLSVCVLAFGIIVGAVAQSVLVGVAEERAEPVTSTSWLQPGCVP